MRLLASLIIVALSLLLAEEIVAGVEISNVQTALIAAFALSVLNATVKPIFVVLTLPITILTLGLFYFVLNGLFFALVAVFIDGFTVEGLIPAVLGALIVSIASTVGNNLLYSAQR